MFQDIKPHKLFNEFRIQEPKESDYVVFLQKETVYCRMKEQQIQLPTVSHVHKEKKDALVYLLSVDEQAFFWLPADVSDSAPDPTDYFEEMKGYDWQEKFIFRGKEPEEIAFGVSVAFHLGTWYNNHRFCGHCGHPFEYSTKERALVCPVCHTRRYPQICPAAIIGIIHNDKILLSKYADGYYRRHALIAGYSEIGETMEQTVHREVMEETGLKVKNIRYFGSQPWPFTGSMLFGFFADLDGDDTITLDEELSEAEWFDREHLPKEDNTLSLTWTMIEYFRNHKDV